jgi:curved DNA-binding protein CbpA
VTSHYDVLGVVPTATHDEIRAAYHEKARVLHPDRMASQGAGEQETARRAMQDVNEAWRVLGDAGRRAAYDRALAAAASPPRPTSGPADIDWDRPYRGTPAQPGDITVAIVRAAPWIAVLIVLVAIVVFTAFARHTSSTSDLVGKCVVTEQGEPHSVPCDEPSDGRVISVVDSEAQCGVNTIAHATSTGSWLCLVDERQ